MLPLQLIPKYRETNLNVHIYARDITSHGRMGCLTPNIYTVPLIFMQPT